MSYFVPCNTNAPLTEYDGAQLRFAVNGSLNLALTTHPYYSVSSSVTASSSYNGTFVFEYGRCGDQVNPTPPGQPIKYESAPSLITTCDTEASSYANNHGSANANQYVTEYDDLSEQGYVLLQPCCGGDCVQKSTAAGGGGINAVLTGGASSGISVIKTYESNKPYCTSCSEIGSPDCNDQSVIFEAGVCRVRSEGEIKSIFCGDDVSVSDNGPGGMAVNGFCVQAYTDGGLPSVDFKGVPGNSYVLYTFSAGMDNDCIEYASAGLLAELSDNTQVLLIAPGALHIEYSGTSAIAIFDNFTKPTSFNFSVDIYVEYGENNSAPWGGGPFTEGECTAIRAGYLKSISEDYTFSYKETISL